MIVLWSFYQYIFKFFNVLNTDLQLQLSQWEILSLEAWGARSQSSLDLQSGDLCLNPWDGKEMSRIGTLKLSGYQTPWPHLEVYSRENITDWKPQIQDKQSRHHPFLWNQIFILRLLLRGSWKFNQSVNVSFVDSEKAYDCVPQCSNLVSWQQNLGSDQKN